VEQAGEQWADIDGVVTATAWRVGRWPADVWAYYLAASKDVCIPPAACACPPPSLYLPPPLQRRLGMRRLEKISGRRTMTVGSTNHGGFINACRAVGSKARAQVYGAASARITAYVACGSAALAWRRGNIWRSWRRSALRLTRRAAHISLALSSSLAPFCRAKPCIGIIFITTTYIAYGRASAAATLYHSWRSSASVPLRHASPPPTPCRARSAAATSAVPAARLCGKRADALAYRR